MELLILEIIAVIFGLLSAWFARKNDKITWIYSFISVVIFAYLFWNMGLVGSTFIQFLFMGISLLGMFSWNERFMSLKIKWSDPMVVATCALGVLFGTLVFGVLFGTSESLALIFGVVQFPVLDSFIMVGSLVAVMGMAYRKVESWVFWIIVDIVAIYVYIMVGMYFVVFQYVFLLGNAIKGLYEWHEETKSPNYR